MSLFFFFKKAEKYGHNCAKIPPSPFCPCLKPCFPILLKLLDHSVATLWSRVGQTSATLYNMVAKRNYVQHCCTNILHRLWPGLNIRSQMDICPKSKVAQTKVESGSVMTSWEYITKTRVKCYLIQPVVFRTERFHFLGKLFEERCHLEQWNLVLLLRHVSTWAIYLENDACLVGIGQKLPYIPL